MYNRWFHKIFKNFIPPIKCVKINSLAPNNLGDGPGLKHFIKPFFGLADKDVSPYISHNILNGHKMKVCFEVYGCQMNFNDAEIAWSILEKHNYLRTIKNCDADIILLVTCAIRESAEETIWKRLKTLDILRQNKKNKPRNVKVGILGCMAERLKEKVFEKEKLVDLIAGPDSYRDLPRLITSTFQIDSDFSMLENTNIKMANVLLSLDETYADVLPARFNNNSPSAFVSIMRGCNNMCSFCIVPYTRGREKNRPAQSIYDEITYLSGQGIKEVTLLGQNVNSYNSLLPNTLPTAAGDTSVMERHARIGDQPVPGDHPYATDYMTPGFRLNYRAKSLNKNLSNHMSVHFSELLAESAQLDPEMRMRFTSPHPKDFPDELLQVIAENPNVCKQIHLPLQSGSTKVLESMRRGYTWEAFIQLMDRARERIKGVAFTTDVIAGFCGETEEDHSLTLDMIERARFSSVYHFAYSMREKTKAHRTLKDDVPVDIKRRRLEEIIALSQKISLELNRSRVGSLQLVLVEKASKRSELDFCGRCDAGIKVIFPSVPLQFLQKSDFTLGEPHIDKVKRLPKIGDYVAVKIDDCSSLVLKGKAKFITTLQGYTSYTLSTPNYVQESFSIA